MASKNECWGIEIGSQAIKAVRLGRSGGGVQLLDYEVLPFPQILTTPDLDVDEAIQVNLQNFLAKHDLRKSQVAVSVPGHMAFARFASLPPVDPKKLPQIVAYEAQQQIPFPIEEVEWDYQVFREEDNPDVKAGIFAITKEKVVLFLNNFRRLDARVDQLTLSPLAVYNAYMFDESLGEDSPGTVFMDIGTKCTDVIIVEAGQIWIRTLPIGGNQFTEAIASQFKISFPKAEKLKREAATSKYARQIMQAMKSVFTDLVQEVQRSIGYYQSMNRDAEITRLVGLGSTFRLPGLRKFLGSQLDLKVEKVTGFSQLSVDGPRQAEFADSAMNLATAYGLAIQGLGLDTVEANLLPAKLLNERMWKSKQPWFAGAAACLAGAAVLVAGRHFMDSSANQSGVDQHKGQVTAVINEGTRYVREKDEALAQSSAPLIENFRRTQDYNNVMPLLHQDVHLALGEVVGTGTAFGPTDRIYLEWIDMTYHAVTEPEGATPDAAVAATGFEAQFGTTPTPTTFFPVAGDQAALPVEEMDPEMAEAVPPPPVVTGGTEGPRFTVRVSLFSPMDRSSTVSLLQNRIVAWLQRESESPSYDRPYRILINANEAMVHRARVVNPRAAVIQSQGEGAEVGFQNRQNLSVWPERPEENHPLLLIDEGQRVILEFEIELLPRLETRQGDQPESDNSPQTPSRPSAAAYPRTSDIIEEDAS